MSHRREGYTMRFIDYEEFNNSDIQRINKYAEDLVDEHIRKPLNIPNNIPRKELMKIVINDLKGSLKFILDFPDLRFVDNKIIYAIQRIDGGDRKNGGIIKINRNLGVLDKCEGILHEYVHIKVPVLPIHTTNKNATNYWLNSQSYNLKITELLAELIFLNLWLSKNEIITYLKIKEFNINEFIKSYTNIKKSTLLQWITLICPFTCHFAWVVIQKDDSGNFYFPIIYDKYRNDITNNTQIFPFETILGNPNSIAAQALATKDSKSGTSNIDNKKYYCYAYYEKDLLRSQSIDYIPNLNCEKYDQLLVIGWNTYDFQQYFSKTP
jgi:hypothetical protein